MRHFLRAISTCVLSFLIISAAITPAAADERSSVVIVFKDGHRQSFSTGEIAHIDLKTPSVIVFKDGHQQKISAGDIASIEFGNPDIGSSVPARTHFFGKWEVGDGGGHNFFITLEPDGVARKTIGSPHGTWSVVDGEARINWDDGWHDAIRKVGSKHEKRAYEPGKSFSDEPNNIANARNTTVKPI